MPVPRPSTEFTFVAPNGTQTLLSSFKGKVVVIQFLSTTCPHCQALSKVLNKMSSDMGPGVQFIGVAFNEATPAMAEAYARSEAVRIPIDYAPHETVLGYLGYSIMELEVYESEGGVGIRAPVRAQTHKLLYRGGKDFSLTGRILPDGPLP